MTGMLHSAIFFVIAVGVLISFHEFGHYWVARKVGVSVLRFSIGFGPALLSFKPKNRETEYVVSAIPLGGYVKMLDENQGEVSPEEVPRAFNRQPLYKRSAIVLAGPMFNFLLAALLYWAVFLIGVEGVRPIVGEVVPDSPAQQAGLQPGDEIVRIDGRDNRSWNQNRMRIIDRAISGEPLLLEVQDAGGTARNVELRAAQGGIPDIDARRWEEIYGILPQLPSIDPVVGEVLDNSPASSAGILPGDRVVEVGGAEVASWRELVSIVSQAAGQSLAIVVDRSGDQIELSVTPETVESEGRIVGRLGITVAVSDDIAYGHRVLVRYGPLESIWRGAALTWEMSAMTVKALAQMLNLSRPTNQLGGPITIAHYAGQAAQSGIDTYLTFLALLSISLGILNLLPIPMLDGGHLLFHVYEAVTGSPPSETVTQWALYIGIAMLAGIMTLAIYNDFANLIF